MRRDGSFSYKRTYDYDENGNQIGQTQENVAGWGRKFSFVHENGKEVERTCHALDGELVSKSICKYDETGNKVEEASYAYRSVSGVLKETPVRKYVYEHEYYTGGDVGDHLLEWLQWETKFVQ